MLHLTKYDKLYILNNKINFFIKKAETTEDNHKYLELALKFNIKKQKLMKVFSLKEICELILDNNRDITLPGYVKERTVNSLLSNMSEGEILDLTVKYNIPFVKIGIDQYKRTLQKKRPKGTIIYKQFKGYKTYSD